MNGADQMNHRPRRRRRILDTIGAGIIAALIYPAVRVMVRDDRRQVQR